MPENKVIRNLIDLRNDYFNTAVRLQNDHKWTEKDARIGVFAKCINVIEPVFFSLNFCSDQLRRPDYQARFSKDHKTPPHPEEVQHQVDNFIQYQQFSYAELLFSGIESSLRVFVRAIDSHACNEGKASFSSISGYLLNKTGLQMYEPLLDMFRLIRNTSHNNGLYLPEENGDRTITWKNQTYEFVIGKPINFVTFPFLIEISKDLKEMLEKMVESEPVRSISKLTDPTFPDGEQIRELHSDV